MIIAVIHIFRPVTGNERQLSLIHLLTISLLVLTLFGIVFAGSVHAQEEVADISDVKEDTQPTPIKRIDFELDLDAYYSSLGMILNLTDKPIPIVEKKNEIEIYKDLLFNSYLPRFVLFEVSINPMPCLGVWAKEKAPDFYNDADVNDDLNWIEALTTGFEEPWAASLFFGNIVTFKRPGDRLIAGNNGFLGYLLSAGNYHIKDNDAIQDNWAEFEWKIKGDRKYSTQKLSWSFRAGLKVHSHREIKDILYVALKRHRLDFKESTESFLLKNTGFEYVLQFDRITFDFISQLLTIEKSWPLKKQKIALSLTVGCMVESKRKYKGSLKEDDQAERFKLLIWPNIRF